MNRLRSLLERLKDLNSKALADIYAGLVIALIIAVISFFTQLGWIGFLIVGVSISLVLVLLILRPQISSTVRRSTEAVVLNNLPARGHFVGRQSELNRLFEGINSNYPVVCIVGESGMGKTSLAKEVGWLNKESGKWFNYVVWIEDHDGDLTSGELYQSIINIWGIYDLKQLNHSDMRFQVAKILQEKSTLIIIDNFDTIVDKEIKEFVRRVPAPVSKVVITSRRREDLPDYWLVDVGEMPINDCLSVAKLELERSGKTSINANSITHDIVELAGGSPYRIRVLIGRFLLGIPLVSTSGQSTYQLLEPWWVSLQDDLILKKTIMSICLFQGNPTREELLRITGLSDNHLLEGLKTLDRTLFLETKYNEVEKTHRYEVHAHTKGFVVHKVLHGEPSAVELLDRMTLWLEEYAEKNGGWRNWTGFRNLNEQFQTIKMIFEWISNGVDDERKKRVIKIWRLIDHFLSVRANLDEYIFIGNLVLKCAQDLNDSRSITDINVEVLGWTYMTKARRATISADERNQLLQSAEMLISDGLKTYQQYGNLIGMGIAHRYLGTIAKLRKDYKTAEIYLKQSLMNFQATRGLDNLGIVLSDLGDLALLQQEFRNAIDYHNRRLIFAQAMNDPEGISVALYNLGNLARLTGQDQDAVKHYRNALKAAKDASRYDIVGVSQYQIAKLLHKNWEVNEALQMALGAKDVFMNNTGTVSEELLALITNLESLISKSKSPIGRLEIFLRKLFVKAKLRAQEDKR